MTDGFQLDLNVEFGGVSFNDQTARLGVRVDRTELDITDVDDYFAGKRIDGRVTLRKIDDEGQPRLEGMEDEQPPEIDAVFDCKQFSANQKRYGFGLTFQLCPLLHEQLTHFAKRDGRLLIRSVEGIPSKSDAADDEGEGDVNVPERPNLFAVKPRPIIDGQDEGAKLSVTALAGFGMTAKKCEALAEHLDRKYGGEHSVGRLEELIRTSQWWHRDVSGFGEAAIDKLSDALFAFRQRYPIPSEDDNAVEAPSVAPAASEAEDEDLVALARERAYTAGCEAAIGGSSALDNPHPAGSLLAVHWLDGWNATNESGSGDEVGTVLDEQGA